MVLVATQVIQEFQDFLVLVVTAEVDFLGIVGIAEQEFLDFQVSVAIQDSQAIQV